MLYLSVLFVCFLLFRPLEMSNDPHNRMKHTQKSSEDDDDDEDHVEKMLNKAGCIKEHYAVQECMAETKDWRQCQEHVQKFKQCIDNSRRAK